MTMPAETPIFRIPYPTGTDRVADGDNSMQAIAERIEAIQHPGTTVAPTSILSGLIVQNSGAYRRGGFCCLWLNLGAPAAGVGVNTGLVTVPVGYRPPHDVFGVVNVGANFATIIVAAAGHIACTSMAIPPSGGLYGVITYPVAGGAAPTAAVPEPTDETDT
jgi:hypothetical protein